MPSTDASADGRSASSAAPSASEIWKNARCSATVAESRPTREASSSAAEVRSLESDPELIDLAIERRERQPKSFRRDALVALRALEDGLDVHALVRAQRLAQIV